MSANIHLKIVKNQSQARAELKKIGVDEVSVPMMAPKMQYLVFKLKNVDVRAANLMKQEMLSKGGEAAVAKWSAGFTKPTTDILLMGSLKHYRLMLKKIKLQPFGMKEIGKELENVLENYTEKKINKWTIRGKELVIGNKKTLIMGILNVTPDSFSDAGQFFNHQIAVEQAIAMHKAGADIIDIGGESTRPGAEPVALEEELNRVIPVIEKLRQLSDVAISIDTQKSRVASEAIDRGADIVNDVSALRNDAGMAEMVAKKGVPLIIMHMKGTPGTMQQNPIYEDFIAELTAFFNERIVYAEKAGVNKSNIAVDPGFGFGKTVDHNLEMLRRLEEFKSLGLPIVIGTSRKSTIGAVLDIPVEERVEGTAATVAIAVANGADIVRVHDVMEISRVVRMTDAIVREDGNG